MILAEELPGQEAEDSLVRVDDSVDCREVSRRYVLLDQELRFVAGPLRGGESCPLRRGSIAWDEFGDVREKVVA